MADRSPILFFVLALAISWLAWAAPAQAEAEQAEGEEAVPAQAEAEEAEGETPEEAKLRRAERRKAGRAKALAAMWWNDPVLVEDLLLSDASRSAMDGHYQGYLDGRSQRAERELQEAFTDALNEGDWEEARKRLQELTVETGRPVKAQGELKIHVLSLLSNEQLVKLLRKKPAVAHEFWSPRRVVRSGPDNLPRRPKGK